MLIDLYMLNHPCEPGMVYNLFDVLLDSVGQNFVENICIYIHQKCWPIAFFLFDFGIRVMVAS